MKLLAKSLKQEYENDKYALTLVGHLELGIKAALEFKTIAIIICDNLGLKMTPDELANTVALAIWIHDWGKVSYIFQAFIHSKSTEKLLKSWYQINETLPAPASQAIRHELLSVILASTYTKTSDWIKTAKNIDFKIALIGVITHHLKTKNTDYFDKVQITEPLKIYTSTVEQSDFQEILELGVKYLNLKPQLPQYLFKQKELNIDFIQDRIKKVKSFCINQECDRDLEQQKKIAVVKALVMSADLAASALFTQERGERNYTTWIEDALAEYLTVAEIKKVIKARLKGKVLLPFQIKEKEYKSRVLIVVAGCGAGKTIVPFVRFQRLIEQGLQAKMFFCYPTTATTSQGFEDYGLTLAEKALLSHSRVWVDYQLRFKDLMATYDEESDDDDDDVVSFQTKVEALKLWHSKLIFCTAHTVLGLIQNSHKGLYSFPAISQGIFVFDEIHAYPPQLFSALLHFIRIFRNTPIVLMSASLTPVQEKAIQDILAETNESADILKGPEEIEILPRYQLNKIDDQSLAWNEIITELKNGGKVLWITNQVADAQHIYTEAKTRFAEAGLSIETLNYHSRFRYQESVHQHEKLVNAFRGDKPVFAVTTQIAEMSLDISCTLLISANAPMWALIQRLGRLNRWVNRIELSDDEKKYELVTGKVCKALIYPWQDEYPYKLEELETGDKLLKLLQDKAAIRQQDLTKAITTLNLNPPKLSFSTWLDTWKTRQEFLMPKAYTIQVILKDDVEKVFTKAAKSKQKASLEAQKFVVSVRIDDTKTKQWQRNKAFKFYRIAPTEDIYYHPEIGAYTPNDEILAKTYGHCTYIQER